LHLVAEPALAQSGLNRKVNRRKRHGASLIAERPRRAATPIKAGILFSLLD
jgi:hypothetical protein